MSLPPLLDAVTFAAGTGGQVRPDDPRINSLLSGATAAVRRYCGWHITPVIDDDIVVDGPGGSVLTLPTLRLVEITSLLEFVALVQGPVDIDPTTLEWSATGEVRKPGRARWTDQWRGIEVSMRHGFDDAADLVQIVQQVVAVALSSPLGATREQAGIYATSWATTAPGVAGGLSLLARDMAVLDTYRLPART